MPTNKTYTVRTIADLLCIVTPENMEALAADIRGLLVNATITKALQAIADPNGTVDIFKGAKITWTDDNVNRQTVSAKTDKTGKELQFITTGKAHEEADSEILP